MAFARTARRIERHVHSGDDSSSCNSPRSLNKSYFRRWFYWHGISRAILYQQSRIDMLSPEETRLDFSKVPHIMGVPRYLYREFLRSAAHMAKSKVAGREQQVSITNCGYVFSRSVAPTLEGSPHAVWR